MSDNLILLLFCITLLLLVIAVVFLVLQERRHAAEKAALVQDYEARRDVLQEEVSSLKSEKSALESRLEVQRQAQEAMLQAEKEHAAKSLEEMRSAFKALSAENSEHFRKTSAESVGELLKPIQERFKEFSEHVKSSDEKNAERSGSMEKMIRILSEQSRSIGDQARALADAITGQSKTQGDFGEMLLVDLLRESGLQEGVNFDVQNVLRDELGHEIKSDDGRVMIPDVIVHYPDGGEVIVDSKVSLKAFVEWNQATIRSIRSHVDELRGKDYASYIPEGRRKIDYNLMFVPIENAFRLMQEEEPLLWQQAKNQGVLIVSQMSLAIVLNMILVAWRQFDQQRNIQEVFKTASELMSALENWMGEYVKVGERLEALNKSYGESTRMLKESSQSVVKKVAKLEKLGATRKRSNAALKTGGRMIGGRESVIPTMLAPEQESEDN